jgi:hypothetical protein
MFHVLLFTQNYFALFAGNLLISGKMPIFAAKIKKYIIADE